MEQKKLCAEQKVPLGTSVTFQGPCLCYKNSFTLCCAGWLVWSLLCTLPWHGELGCTKQTCLGSPAQVTPCTFPGSSQQQPPPGQGRHITDTANCWELFLSLTAVKAFPRSSRAPLAKKCFKKPESVNCGRNGSERSTNTTGDPDLQGSAWARVCTHKC